MSQSNCQSCGMPIEHGPYCQYCADDHGRLHGFQETVRRMSAFWQSRDGSLTSERAEQQTLEHMAQMPAWKDHPELKEKRKG